MGNIKTLDKIVVGRRPVTTNNLWVDTTKGNPFIKVYKNGEWVAIDDVTREEVDWIKDEIHRLTDLTPEELDTLKEVADKLIEIEGKFDDYMPLNGGTMSKMDGDERELFTRVYPNDISVIEDRGYKVYSSGISCNGLGIHNIDDSTYIKLYGISHPDGYIEYSDILTKTALQNSDLKIGSEDEKHSLEVSGTTRLKGELKLTKSVSGNGDTNVKGIKSLAAHTITTDSEIKAASVRVDSSLTVGGETNLNGSLNMNGNDVNLVQSIDVEGTGRFDTVKTHVLKGNEDGKPLLIQGDVEFENPIVSDEFDKAITFTNPYDNGIKIKHDDYSLRFSSIYVSLPGDELPTLFISSSDSKNMGYDYGIVSINTGSFRIGNEDERYINLTNRAFDEGAPYKYEHMYAGFSDTYIRMFGDTPYYDRNGKILIVANRSIELKDKDVSVSIKDLFVPHTYEVEVPINESYVDLGLPSGLLWATYNVGANTPEEFGDYYAWGELETKSTYTQDNYTYTDNPETLPLSADVAHVKWGGSWRMPTRALFEELFSNTFNKYTKQNGMYGMLITGKNGKSIFIPLVNRDNPEYYWSSSLSLSDNLKAGMSRIGMYDYFVSDFYRSLPCYVRPVTSTPPTKPITIKKTIYVPLKDVVEENEQVTAAALVDLNNTKLADAPADGKQYARKDGEWSEVEGGDISGTLESDYGITKDRNTVTFENHTCFEQPVDFNDDVDVNGYDISDVNSLSCDNLTCDNLTVDGHDIEYNDDRLKVDNIETNSVRTDKIASDQLEIANPYWENKTGISIYLPDYGDDEPSGGIYGPSGADFSINSRGARGNIAFRYDGLSIQGPGATSNASITIKQDDIYMYINGKSYSMSSILDKLANID